MSLSAPAVCERRLWLRERRAVEVGKKEQRQRSSRWIVVMQLGHEFPLRVYAALEHL